MLHENFSIINGVKENIHALESSLTTFSFIKRNYTISPIKTKVWTPEVLQYNILLESILSSFKYAPTTLINV